MERFKRLAPFFLAGPVSGPLLAGVVLNLKDRRFVLSGLYAVALVEYTLLLPAITAKLSLDLPRQLDQLAATFG